MLEPKKPSTFTCLFLLMKPLSFCINRLASILLFLFILLSLSGFAQQRSSISSASRSDFILPPQFFRFVLVTGLTGKASLQNTEGSYPLKSSLQPGFEGGVDYLHSITHNLYYSLGAHLMVTGRSVIFPMPALSSNPNAHFETFPAEKDKQFDPTLAIPLLIEKILGISHRKSVYLNAGVQLTIPITSEHSGFGVSLPDSTGEYLEVYNQDAQAYNRGTPWLSFKLGSGIQWVLTNQNVLSIGIVAHLSTRNFVQGNYRVSLPNQPATVGTLRANGSYVGIVAAYSLTRKFRKRIGE